jgi:hypothetical protein
LTTTRTHRSHRINVVAISMALTDATVIEDSVEYDVIERFQGLVKTHRSAMECRLHQATAAAGESIAGSRDVVAVVRRRAGSMPCLTGNNWKQLFVDG